MYPLILLILLVSVGLNLGLAAVGEAAHAEAGAAMKGGGLSARPQSRRAVSAHARELAVIVLSSRATSRCARRQRRSPTAPSCFRGRIRSGCMSPKPARPSRFALALAIAGGLAIGLTLGLSRLASEVFEPMLVAIYSIPKITLYPILLLAFGLGISAKVAFGTLHGIIPIALFTINGGPQRQARPAQERAYARAFAVRDGARDRASRPRSRKSSPACGSASR